MKEIFTGYSEKTFKTLKRFRYEIFSLTKTTRELYLDRWIKRQITVSPNPNIIP